jgi:predicted ATPase/transcriptional regulator with XRE-family HTH domain
MVALEPSTFGDVLRQLRLEAGLTQEELAERAGLSARGLSDLERGLRRTPRLGTVRLVADALHLDDTRRERLLGSRQPRCVWNSAGAAAPRGIDVSAGATTPLHPDTAGLIDRQHDVAELRRLVRTHRLVTLTGPGGVGKTRLAMHLVGLIAEQFADGVCLVDLSAVTEDQLVAGAVAAALDVSDTHAEPSATRVAEVVGSQQLLLVLDNCEQVIRGVAALVGVLARACAGLSVLCTSRERLAIGGEAAWPVDPLAVPPHELANDVPRAMTYPAIELFVERARAALPQFELTPRNVAAVVEVCRRLDGLPLAIELAAARARLLTVQQIAARLDDRFRLLTNGPRSAPSRQRALWDAIAWSYDLLAPTEQQLLRTLSVFAGGFSLESAEAIAAPGPTVVDSLARLVDQSLVTVEHDREATRFGLLESVRAFARERLDEAGETETARRRHTRFFAHEMARAEAGLSGAEQQARLLQLERERDNVRVAIARAVAAGDAEAAVRMGSALWRFWVMAGHLEDGRRWTELTLPLLERAPAGVRADGLNAAGAIFWAMGELEQAEALELRALELRREMRDGPGIARTLRYLGNVAASRGELEAGDTYLQAAMQVAERCGDKATIILALVRLATSREMQGQLNEAAALLTQALAGASLHLGPADMALVLRDLARVTLGLGEAVRAAALGAEALARMREVDSRWGSATCLEVLGAIACALGQPERAARLLGSAARLRSTGANPSTPMLETFPARAHHDELLSRVRSALGPDAFSACWDAGWRLSTPAVDAEAQALIEV